MNIDFNNYDSLVSESEFTDAQQENVDENQTEPAPDSEIETETEAEEFVSPISNGNRPPELKLMTLNLNVEAPDYESLQQFISEIENLERILHIDSINYQLPGEESLITETGKILQFRFR